MSWLNASLLLWIDCSLIALMVLCATGHKLGVLPFKIAFLLFLLSGALVSLGSVFGLIGIVMGHAKTLWPMVLVGALPLAFFLFTLGSGSLKVPKIHDVSTRSEPPIVFTEAVHLRKKGDNSLEPASERVVLAQHAFYTHIQPLTLTISPDRCFDTVLSAVEELGWVLIAKDTQGRWVEAYEATSFFGFVDDVRIELTETEQGECVVNARSVSRVGVSDMGVNAKRIRQLFTRIAEG